MQLQQKVLIGYRLKKEYPGQRIGDMVTRPMLSIPWKFQNTKTVIDEKLLTTNWFEPIYFEGTVGQEWLYRNGNRIQLVTIQKLHDNGKVTVSDANGKTLAVDVASLSNVIYYYAFNSLLQSHRMEVRNNKTFEEMQLRSSIGNCFETKEDCDAAVNLIYKALSVYNLK